MDSNNNNNIGMICEQGDLGLHFTPLTKEEQKVLNESETGKHSDEK